MLTKHPWAGEVFVVPSLHEKEKIFQPLLYPLGIECRALKVNTDSLGTFSGEVERKGSIREVLRAKIQLAIATEPQSRFVLASEGSFVPHPLVVLLKSNLECLLLYDLKTESEIFVEHFSTDVVNDEVALSRTSDVDPFLTANKFPQHGLIVRPFEGFDPVFKGIHLLADLQQAIEQCRSRSPSQRVMVQVDLRAHHNPTRQDCIREAAKKLVDRLNMFCPVCKYPGYGIVAGIPGLPCEACGEPTEVTKSVICECAQCAFTEQKPRPDGLLYVSTDQCPFCNP